MCGDDVVVSIAEGESDVEDGGGHPEGKDGSAKAGEQEHIVGPSQY
jgi:hypothetical protein